MGDARPQVGDGTCGGGSAAAACSGGCRAGRSAGRSPITPISASRRQPLHPSCCIAARQHLLQALT